MQQRTQGLVDETHFNISIQEAQFSHLSLALMVSSPALLPSSKYIALSLFSHSHSLWLSLSLSSPSLLSLPPSPSPHYSLIQAVQSLTTTHTHTRNKKATTSGLMSKKKKNKCPCCPACLPGSAGKRVFVSLVIKTPAGFQLPQKPACVLSFVFSFLRNLVLVQTKVQPENKT